MKMKWTFIPLVLLMVIMLASCSSANPELVGSMDSYQIDWDDKDALQYIGNYEARTNFHMSESILNDMSKHPDDYAACWINFSIQNQTDHPIYSVQVELSKSYRNLWLDTSSLCECQPLDIEQDETYESCAFVVIKTKDLSKDEINDLITGMKISLSYSNHSIDENDLGFLLSFYRRNTSVEYAN